MSQSLSDHYYIYATFWCNRDVGTDSPPAFTDAVIALQLAASGKYDPDMDVNGDGVVTSLDAWILVLSIKHQKTHTTDVMG